MNKTTIIAEAGVNHNGDVILAKKLVDAAIYAGADIIKFQSFKAEKITTKSAKKTPYQESKHFLLVFLDKNFFIKLKVCGTTLQKRIFSIYLNLKLFFLNIFDNLLIVISFDEKIIFLIILFFLEINQIFVSVFPISPKIYINY